MAPHTIAAPMAIANSISPKQIIGFFLCGWSGKYPSFLGYFSMCNLGPVPLRKVRDENQHRRSVFWCRLYWLPFGHGCLVSMKMLTIVVSHNIASSHMKTGVRPVIASNNMNKVIGFL
jgi:hypothetical protein